MFNDQLALEDALIPVGENISFLPSGYTSLDPSVVANSKQIYSEINRCAADYDVVLIDSPPINFSPDTKFIISDSRTCYSLLELIIRKPLRSQKPLNRCNSLIQPF